MNILRETEVVPNCFSVIIPVYNKENHLRRCLDSVLAQSFTRIEVIVVDDNSFDSSLEIARSYAQLDNRVRVLQRDRPGPGGYGARNLGLKEARCDWCAFLDADDEWQKDHLEIAANLIQRYPECILITSGWLIDDGVTERLDDYLKSSDSKVPKVLTLDDYFEGPRPIWTGVVRAKTGFLREVGGFDERWRHGADLQYWLRLFLKGDGAILWAPVATAIYHTDSDNMVTKNLSQTLSPTAEFIHSVIESSSIDEVKARKMKQFANRSQVVPFVRYLALGGAICGYAKKHFFLKQLTLVQIITLGFLTLTPKKIRMELARRFLDRYARNK